MKAFAATIFLVLFLAGGCNYIAIAGGQGGEFDAANLTVEYGSPPPDEIKSKVNPGPGKRDLMLTGGMTIIDNGIDLGYFKSSPEMGGFIKLGVEVVPDTGLFANVLGGVTWIIWNSVWTEQETEWYGMFGGGLTYFINDKDACILAGYDNRRGFTAGVGLRF